MLSIFLLIPLSLMLFVVAIWAVRYAVKSNQFEDLDNASQRIILDDRQERRQTMQAHQHSTPDQQGNDVVATDTAHDAAADTDSDTSKLSDSDHNPKI
ncbi:cbb3-type cytochrome oxidase assembly protein CcoS [Psychrobacter sp. AOP22-C1-22]|uniref:cbb3-type cytochrome oxidase assembly protein CcoS n=1 Tax=unclassified Psychrobacter TaxID=196806 RepID=UPI00178860AD|nr:cbb3-type cytochrome oxidase assembly protein CcoS [Psychrobacter sp. FME6]MBE0407076.1 cbb3-type cytochrome oxidase assembly protein CcoS [Psychrobacter sp. FME6]